jgi:hypothetical protein
MTQSRRAFLSADMSAYRAMIEGIESAGREAEMLCCPLAGCVNFA